MVSFIFMKRFTARFKDSLYKKLKDYADENEMTVMGAIKYIITQFLKAPHFYK